MGDNERALQQYTIHYDLKNNGWYVKNNKINRIITPYISQSLAEKIINDKNEKIINKPKKKDLYYYFEKMLNC